MKCSPRSRVPPSHPSTFYCDHRRQIPEVLFTLVNLSRLNLAGTKIGPMQGAQLEERLRLDSLTVNADACDATVPADASSSPETPAEAQEVQQQDGSHTTNAVGGCQATPGRKCVSRPTSVPDHRLPEIRDKVVRGIRVPRRHAQGIFVRMRCIDRGGNPGISADTQELYILG